MGSGKKMCPPTPTLPMLLGLGVLHPCPYLQVPFWSAKLLGPLTLILHLCSFSHFISCFSSFIPYSSENLDSSHPPSVHRPPRLQCATPKVPVLSRLWPRNAPSPAVCLKVWVTLGHRHVIENCQQLLLYRRSSASSQRYPLTFPQGWSEGGRPRPLPSRHVAPSPGFCCPA